MPETILDLLQNEKVEARVQGRYTRIVVNPGPYFEVLGSSFLGGPYVITLYSGELEFQAVAAFIGNESK